LKTITKNVTFAQLTLKQ